MEKRTPNDADDAGPLGQHHRHHCPPGKHERGLARRPGHTLYNAHVPWLWTAFCPFPTLLWLQSLSNAGNVGADLPPKMQSWAKTWSACLKSFLDGFP